MTKAVLARLERPLPAPETAAVLAGTLAAGAALTGALAYFGVPATALFGEWSVPFDPSLWDAAPWLAAWTRAAARPSGVQLLGAAAAAFALWLSTHRPLWGGRQYDET
jgi:hypothetical protein